jgi:hypothetical protein
MEITIYLDCSASRDPRREKVLLVAAVGMKVGRDTGKWEITRAIDEQPELGGSRVEKWTQASESSPASLLVGVTKGVSDSRSRRARF